MIIILTNFLAERKWGLPAGWSSQNCWGFSTPAEHQQSRRQR